MCLFVEFLLNFVATTFGVVLALILQKWYEDKKDADEAKGIKQKLKTELESIQHNMLDIHKTKQSELLLNPIKMPIFQGFVNSTKIALLDRYVWYNDLLSLYKYLDTYNAWHDLKTSKSFTNTISHISPNLYSQVDNSLLEIEKIVLGLANIEQTKLSEDEAGIVIRCDELNCKLQKCTLNSQKDVNGLINCMISKLSIDNGNDLIKDKSGH